MPQNFEQVSIALKSKPKKWLVTGVAGFIGSHLLENLLQLGQQVVGLDNLSTGFEANLETVEKIVGPANWSNFTFHQGSVADPKVCAQACKGVDVILHQAALGSVPRSIDEPLASHEANVNGFIILLEAARAAGIKRFVYASSSSVYGDSPVLPKKESQTGHALSPYASTKAINEEYARTWFTCYQMETVGLRYFNVFGPRQDPNGAYAAVVPRWLDCVLKGQSCTINGDGETSRDFCYVDNVVQANILSAVAPIEACGEAYNVACGEATTLQELHDSLWQGGISLGLVKAAKSPIRLDFRKGDIKHSLADISRSKTSLGFSPVVSFREGIEKLLRVVAS